MVEPDPGTLSRVRREKAVGSQGVDFGAISVGVMCPLFMAAPGIVLSISIWIVIALMIGGLAIGGWITARLLPDQACRTCHSGVLVLGFYLLMITIATAAWLAPASTPIAPTYTPPAAVLIEFAQQPEIALGTALAGIFATLMGQGAASVGSP